MILMNSTILSADEKKETEVSGGYKGCIGIGFSPFCAAA